jgi:hypothetical protein
MDASGEASGEASDDVVTTEPQAARRVRPARTTIRR